MPTKNEKTLLKLSELTGAGVGKFSQTVREKAHGLPVFVANFCKVRWRTVGTLLAQIARVQTV